MNAIPDQSALASVPVDWEAIYAEVNAWRGECMHHFSAVEHAVTETLLVLDGAKPDGVTIRLRHLIGQRFEDLSDAIGLNGPFAEKGRSAAKSLAHYREQHEAFRTQLCHGHLAVSVCPNGHWLLVLRTLSIRGRQADTGLVVIEQTNAVSRLEELRRDGRKLAAVLGQVRQGVVGVQTTK
ncbi:hypothetical protein [Erythrobacter sp.]|uniref:hypothetical protein n=1 Tax=Erythrobacter sp. TaxID=1042 RepID=UPI00311FD9B4